MQAGLIKRQSHQVAIEVAPVVAATIPSILRSRVISISAPDTRIGKQASRTKKPVVEVCCFIPRMG